ncbi:peptide deformylase 1B, chloroplastic/mitochondrial [Silene latifolia]|uniref:peptide deformylase 1B, chloroplastic/mitochondrial n=1 Tax=Silene latifolia TaxID=37657 RepID=UPI003D78066A
MSSTIRPQPLQWCTPTAQLLPISSHTLLTSFHPSSSFSQTHLFSSQTLKLHSKISTKFRSMASKKDPFKFQDEDFASSDDLQFEAPLKVVEYPDPRLRAKNKKINKFDDNLKKLVAEMFDVMYRTDGIGLSAPQVGVNVQLMVFNPVGERGEGEEIVLINPRVTKYSQKLTLFNEGCLSFPGLFGVVKRPESVKIDAKNLSGSRFSVTLSGLPARVFQHEFDHLEGTLFFEKMTEEVLDTIREGLQALEVKYEKSTGLPSPEKIEIRQRTKAGVGFGKN